MMKIGESQMATLRSATGPSHVVQKCPILKFVAVQSNFKLGGALVHEVKKNKTSPFTEQEFKKKNPFYPYLNGLHNDRDVVAVWAREILARDADVVGVQEGHPKRAPMLAQALRTATGDSWDFYSAPMGKTRIHHRSSVSIFHRDRHLTRSHERRISVYLRRTPTEIKVGGVTLTFLVPEVLTGRERKPGDYKLTAVGALFRPKDEHCRHHGFWFWSFKLPWDEYTEENRKSAFGRFYKYMAAQRNKHAHPFPMIIATDLNSKQGTKNAVGPNTYSKVVVEKELEVAHRDAVDHILFKGRGLSVESNSVLKFHPDVSDHNGLAAYFRLE